MLSEHPFLIQVLFYGATIIIFWSLELILYSEKPLIKGIHSLLNARFLFFIFPIQIAISTLVFYNSNWTTEHGWGILQWFFLTDIFIVDFIIVFIVIDFFDYIYHVLMHKVPFLWRFHQIHHSDMKVDITTTIREHPGETVCRVSNLAIVVFILGVPPGILLLKTFTQSFVNLTTHSSVKLPERLNKIIALVFVTPNVHHIHHHYKMPYTDMNYGDTLTIWDRLFSTYSNLEQSKIVYGIDTFMDEEKSSKFMNLLKRPFDNSIHHSTKPDAVELET